MKKALIIFVTLTMLIASFAFVGGASADENDPHLCIYTGGLFAPPNGTMTLEYRDVNGVLYYSETLDNTNGTDLVFTEPSLDYLPLLNGTMYITITIDSESVTITLSTLYNSTGECFNDGRLNSSSDRDLAAPVSVYIRFSADGDGFDGYDVYDINQFAGTGTLSLRVTDDEINDAADEAVATGANVTVAQDGDVIFTVLASSTDETAVCQVNAVDQEGKPYEYQWTCLG